MAANGDGRVIRLTAERLQRLERRMANVTRVEETHARLEQAIDVLTRLVRVVAAQNVRVNATFARLAGRLDRLSKATMHARTADARRLGRLTRRLASLERDLARR